MRVGHLISQFFVCLNDLFLQIVFKRRVRRCRAALPRRSFSKMICCDEKLSENRNVDKS